MKPFASNYVYAIVAFVFGILITTAFFRFVQIAVPDHVATTNPSRQATQNVGADVISSERPHVEIRAGQGNPYGSQSLDDVLQLGNLFDVKRDLYALLDEANESEIRALFDQADSIDSANLRTTVKRIVVERLVLLDPLWTIQHIRDLGGPDYGTLLYTAFFVWAQLDLDAAIDASGTIAGSDRRIPLQGILRATDHLPLNQRERLADQLAGHEVLDSLLSIEGKPESRDDPRIAIRDAESERSGSLTSRVNKLWRIAFQWYQDDGAAIIPELIELIEEPNARATIVSGLLNRELKNGHAHVLAIIDDVPDGSSKNRIVQDFLRNWARNDAKNAYEAATELDKKSSVYTNRTTVVSVWSLNDPMAVLETVDSMEGEFGSTTRSMAIVGLASKSPATAIEYLDQMEDTSSRDSLMFSLAHSWTRQDPESALNWLLTKPWGLTKTQSITDALEQIALDNPLKALRIATSEDGELGTAMDVAVVRVIAKSDMNQALSLLEQMREPSRLGAMQEIGKKLVKTNPALAIDLGATLNKEQFRSYYKQLASEWANQSAATAINNINLIPDDRLQLMIARTLLDRHERSGDLTDEQIHDLRSLLVDFDHITDVRR